MSRFAWDALASDIFRNLPSDKSFRQVCHEMTGRIGAEQWVRIINRHYPEVSSSAMLTAIKPLREGRPMRSCPRCGRKTPNKGTCACCSKNATEGDLTERERERLEAHYREAWRQYGSGRGPVVRDEYVDGLK